MSRSNVIDSEGKQTGRISMISNKISTASNGLEYYYVKIMNNNKGMYHVIEAYGNDAIELESKVTKIMVENINDKTKLPFLFTNLYCQD